MLARTWPKFLNIPSRDDIPPGWRLATVNDVRQFPQLAQTEITHRDGISTLADGRICGKGKGYEVDHAVNDAYGGPCSEKLIVQGMLPIQ